MMNCGQNCNRSPRTMEDGYQMARSVNFVAIGLIVGFHLRPEGVHNFSQTIPALGGDIFRASQISAYSPPLE